MFKYLNILFIFTLIGCAHCSNDPDPYIRIQPGIEYCGDMCSKFVTLQCVGYFEDLDINCKSDPIYTTWYKCQDAIKNSLPDSGDIIVKMTCKEFCEYEMSTSVQLNPKCLADNLKSCDEIEKICQ